MSISHKRLRVIKGGRNRATRPKTFKTEEAAKAWADKQGFKKYILINLKSAESKTKKIRVKVLG
jgi:hypothetical protein